MAQVVPLSTLANQSFPIQLTVDGRTLTLQLYVYFSEMAGYWLMDVADQAGTWLLHSVPLLTGSYPAANLLAPYAYLGIGSAFVINASGVAQDNADATNLGTDFVLVWDDTPAS